MERSLIAHLKLGERNKVQGFVENIRNKRTMAFLVLRDYTGRVQLTIEKEKYPEIGRHRRSTDGGIRYHRRRHGR